MEEFSDDFPLQFGGDGGYNPHMFASTTVHVCLKTMLSAHLVCNWQGFGCSSFEDLGSNIKTILATSSTLASNVEVLPGFRAQGSGFRV